MALGLAVLLAGAAGCGDTDERPVTWSYISATIVQPNCGTARCHAKGSLVGPFGNMLALDQVQPGYDNISVFIGFDDNGDPQRDPAMTTLVDRLRGRNMVPARMPPDEPLPEADIKLIEAWIKAGSPNN